MEENILEIRSGQEVDFDATFSEIENKYPLPPREFDFRGNVGDILDLRNVDRSKVGVPTDCGVVANKNQELLTEKVVGCAAVFFKGKESNAFFHLTPNSKLGYRYFKYPKDADDYIGNSAMKVMESLPKEERPEDYEVIILVNIGSEDGGNYDYHKILADAKNFASKLKGIEKVKIVELPLNSTMLYYSPKIPNQIFACGDETKINERGGLDYGRKVVGLRVDLDPSIEVDYVLHSLLEKAA